MACKPPEKTPPVMAPVIAAIVALDTAGTKFNDVDEDALYCVSLILLFHGKEDRDGNCCWFTEAGRAVATKGEDGINPRTEFSASKRHRHCAVDILWGAFILFCRLWMK